MLYRLPVTTSQLADGRRAVSLHGHPAYIATLLGPSRSSSRQHPRSATRWRRGRVLDWAAQIQLDLECYRSVFTHCPSILLSVRLSICLFHMLILHLNGWLPVSSETVEGLRERTGHLDIFLFFPPITQWCSISNVLFTGGREVSDFSVIKYY